MNDGVTLLTARKLGCVPVPHQRNPTHRPDTPREEDITTIRKKGAPLMDITHTASLFHLSLVNKFHKDVFYSTSGTPTYLTVDFQRVGWSKISYRPTTAGGDLAEPFGRFMEPAAILAICLSDIASSFPVTVQTRPPLSCALRSSPNFLFLIYRPRLRPFSPCRLVATPIT